jgi:hypothetical protein
VVGTAVLLIKPSNFPGTFDDEARRIAEQVQCSNPAADPALGRAETVDSELVAQARAAGVQCDPSSRFCSNLLPKSSLTPPASELTDR